MKWFRNLQIKPKLLLSFSVVIAFTVVLAVIAVFTANRIDESYTYLLEFPQKRYEYLLRMESGCASMRQSVTALVMNCDDSEKVEEYWSQFEQAYKNEIENIDGYLEKNSSDTVRDAASISSGSETVSKLKDLLESYREVSRQGMESALATGDAAEANAFFVEASPMIVEAGDIIRDLLPKESAYTDEVSALNTRDKDSSVLLLFAVLAAVFVISMTVAFYVAGQLSKPISTLTSFMQKAGSTGDVSLRPEDVENISKLSQIKDEIGQCIGSTASFVGHISTISEQLRMVADGNLTGNTKILSESDVMGTAMQRVTDSLNGMFGDIRAATTQVSAGSRQIADGAQLLAQGTGEQASAIQELSASIGEIAGKTKDNAGVAREAAELSRTIRDSAEKGSAQMGQMMQAVKEINEASNQINKVIKVIDDIAFQTNILALNAAVEAARAGQHGKGFAVVAEEVRNLAAKSAEAARDTGGLIENSIEKANFGLSIATNTASSLKEIVDGINRSAEIVSQIANSSDEQAAAISEINGGIEQVAQVVQQNSATSQQSAAASEEMSGQAEMLNGLIAQFKLKNTVTEFFPDQSVALGAAFRQPVPQSGPLEPNGGSGLNLGKYSQN